MWRATISLPVPDSPRISTLVSNGATCSISRCTSRMAREVPLGPKAMRARLSGMAVADVLRLIQDGGQAALLDGQLEMQPGQIAAALGDFRQSVAAQINDRQRLRPWRAAARRVRAPCAAIGLRADDHREPIVRPRVRRAAEFRQIVDANRLEVQKTQQGLQSFAPANLRVRSQLLWHQPLVGAPSR